jgi:hypothetical protein
MNELWQSNYTFQEECKKSIDIKTTYILSLEARIAELEALQAPKTCETCEHWTHDVNGDIDPNMMFGECMLLGIQGKFFYCADYEPKDSK